MTARQPRSAGIVLFRQDVQLEVLLAHPGGPFWRIFNLYVVSNKSL